MPTPIATYTFKTPPPPSGTSTSPAVTSAFTPSNGEELVVKLESWDTGNPMQAPTGGGLTYTQRAVVAPGGFRPWVGIYTAVVSGSPTNMTVSSSPTSAGRYSMTVERWPSGSIGSTPVVNSTNAGTGTAQSTMTITAGSAISWVASDAQSLDPSNRSYVGTTLTVDQQVRDDHSGSNGVGYHGLYSPSAGGSQLYGLTDPGSSSTGMQWDIAGIEVKAAASTTPFTKTVTEAYRVLNAWTKPVTEAYRVLNAWNKSSAESYRLLNAFSKPVAESYRVLNGWTTSLSESYRVLNVWTSSTTEAYRVLGAWSLAVSDQYRVLNGWTLVTAESYRILNAFSEQFTEGYNVLSGTAFTLNATERYRIFNVFSVSQPESYRVLGSFSLSRSERYRILNAWALNAAEAYRILNAWTRTLFERYTVGNAQPPVVTPDITARLSAVLTTANLSTVRTFAHLGQPIVTANLNEDVL